MKQKSFLCLLIIFTLLSWSFVSYAHSGRTDSNGGHFDSNTGEYHYHHGYPAYQHTNGVCPYDFDDNTNSSLSSGNTYYKSNPSSGTRYRSYLSSGIKDSSGSSGAKEVQKFSSDDYKQLQEENTKLKNDYNDAQKYLLNFKLGSGCIFVLLVLLTFYSHHVRYTKKNSQLRNLNEAYTRLSEENLQLKKDNSQLYDENISLQESSLLKEINSTKRDFSYLQLKYKEECEKNVELKVNIVKLTHYLNTISKLYADLNYKDNLANMVFSDEELLKKAGVPEGVTFDSDLLPHYFANSTVENNFHVYISENGKCYHRKFSCSGATIPVHLFTVADIYTPCTRCIPWKAQKYKIPSWYYRYLRISQFNQRNAKHDTVRYQLNFSSLESTRDSKEECSQ